MSDFIEKAAAYKLDKPLLWLGAFQRDQRALWENADFPKRNTEHWKYTSLRVLEKNSFLGEYQKDESYSKEIAKKIEIADLDSIDLVFVNGHFDSTLSSGLHDLEEGLTLSVFSQAEPEQQHTIKSKLGSVAGDDKHLFVTLNGSQLSDGVFVHADKNCRLERPVRIVNVLWGSGKNYTVSPRLFVLVDESASLKVVEQFVSDVQEQPDFVNSVSEFELGSNAKLEHYRLHLEHESSIHLGGVHTNLGRDSVFDSFQLALGSKIKRIDLLANIIGEGAHCEINGIYLPSNTQHVDFHTCVEHKVANCTSSEVFRGIISDKAKAVFNGRIHIHKDAQKTFAKLSNKNLLTSNQAEIDTKPELEIYADDVQCAHGATVAQLDDNAMHYLMTRGVSKEEARVMLSFGFINELVNTMKNDAIAAYLRPKLASLFARDAELLRHIV